MDKMRVALLAITLIEAIALWAIFFAIVTR
jgi:hypothetical protein